MPRGDQLARQWKIIQTLITSRRGKSAAELASDLECHPRTLYRDFEALQVAWFPIYTEKVERKNLWSLLDTLKHHIPFSLTELMALYFSTDMLKTFKGTAFHDSLSQKIKATLPPESMNYLKNVQQTLQVGIKPYKDYAGFKEIINRVNEAALQKRSVGMVYYTMSRKKEGKREVDPYRIWFSPDAAGYIKEKIWHDTQEIVSQKDGSIVFEAEVAGTEEIKFWVMSWGSKAEVLEPKSLREEIRVEAEAAAEKYGKPVSAQAESVSA